MPPRFGVGDDAGGDLRLTHGEKARRPCFCSCVFKDAFASRKDSALKTSFARTSRNICSISGDVTIPSLSPVNLYYTIAKGKNNNKVD